MKCYALLLETNLHYYLADQVYSMAMFAENMEHIDMIRTPLKARNQEFTPGLGYSNCLTFHTP